MTDLKAAALKHVSCVSALIDTVSEQDKISQRNYLLYDLESKMPVMGLIVGKENRYALPLRVFNAIG